MVKMFQKGEGAAPPPHRLGMKTLWKVSSLRTCFRKRKQIRFFFLKNENEHGKATM